MLTLTFSTSSRKSDIGKEDVSDIGGESGREYTAPQRHGCLCAWPDAISGGLVQVVSSRGKP